MLTKARGPHFAAGALVFPGGKVDEKDKNQVYKVQIATKRAIVALIVAYFARIDLVIAPFWLVWVFAFWQGGDSGGWV